MTTPFEEEEDETLVGSLTGTAPEAPLVEPTAPLDNPQPNLDPVVTDSGVGSSGLPETPQESVPTEETPTEDVPEEEDESSFFSLADALLAPARGVEEFGRDLYGLVDFVSFDSLPDLSEDRLLGQSNSTVGAFLAESVNFALGFVPVAGALGKVGKVGRVLDLTKRAEAAASGAARVGIRWGRDAVAGAAVDFAFFDEQEQRISTILSEVPALRNPVLDYLAADEGDTQLEGRMKQMLEGGIMGLGVDAFMTGLKAFRRMARVKDAGGTATQMREAVDDMQDELRDAILDPTGAADLDSEISTIAEADAVQARAYFEERPLSEQESKVLNCEC